MPLSLREGCGGGRFGNQEFQGNRGAGLPLPQGSQGMHREASQPGLQQTGSLCPPAAGFTQNIFEERFSPLDAQPPTQKGSLSQTQKLSTTDKNERRGKHSKEASSLNSHTVCCAGSTVGFNYSCDSALVPRGSQDIYRTPVSSKDDEVVRNDSPKKSAKWRNR